MTTPTTEDIQNVLVRKITLRDDIMEKATAADGTALNANEKLTLLALVDKYNQKRGYAWPSVNWLARVTLQSERNTRRVLHRLERLGLISIVPRETSEGSRITSNAYYFTEWVTLRQRDIIREGQTKATARAQAIVAGRAAAQERRERNAQLAAPSHLPDDTAMASATDTVVSQGIGHSSVIWDTDMALSSDTDMAMSELEPLGNRYLEPGSVNLSAKRPTQPIGGVPLILLGMTDPNITLMAFKVNRALRDAMHAN